MCINKLQVNVCPEETLWTLKKTQKKVPYIVKTVSDMLTTPTHAGACSLQLGNNINELHWMKQNGNQD